DVAEDDRLGGTRLRAGGGEAAVLERLVLALGVDARRVDALHAVGALLHDAAEADADVGIALQLQRLGRPVGELVEVEAPYLVRAVVAAVAGAHAAVVDHVVEPLHAVVGRRHRADHLAGGVLALHAGDRLVVDRFGLVVVAGVVLVDAQPLHLAAAEDLVLADDGDVVLGDAGDDAGVAAGARREVDRHPPLVPLVGPVWVERHVVRRRLDRLVRELGL